MIFVNETAAINGIADTILKGGVSLYNAIKYIYSITEKDFYNVNIKDAFKVVLNNVTDTDSLQALGLRINDRTCIEMQNEEYNRVLPMIVYSLAVRIPTLKNVKNGDDFMSDDQLYRLYTTVMEKGAENYNDLISETFLETKYLVRKGKKIPTYTADWYKTYIYNYVPSLAEITNKNMFLFGLVDVLFAMFYTCLEEELHNKIIEFAMDAAEGGEE
ncbi:MAG: hypothetical protein IJ035_02135 [Oscillospiraceae bacterium]|nr:hypothetical protein [Oscillospiraceae bacterium]